MKPIMNHYCLTFASVEERDALDACIKERLAKAEASPLVSHEEAVRHIARLRERMRHAVRTVEQ